jgi:ribosome maturation factor RimP
MSLVNWQAAVETTVTGLGYEMVDCERGSQGLLRVMIDRVPGAVYATDLASGSVCEFITVEDCEKVTRQLQLVLEVEGCDYSRLEVSSPGLDRPLKKAADYARFAGERVELTLKLPFQGRKKYAGLLMAGDQEGAWALQLVAPTAVAAKGSRAAKRRVTSAAAVASDATPEQVLNFMLDEVRDARLVPVVDFKGRGGRAQPEPAAQISGGHQE